MNIKQDIVLDIHHLNAYIIEDVPGKIVVNNQGNGLYILDDSLKHIQDMVFLHDVKIEHIYKKNDHTELLLFCPQNRCLVHVNMKTYKHTIIAISGEFTKFDLIPIYLWNDTICYMTTPDHIYSVDTFTGTITRAIDVEVREDHHTFYQCWDKYRTEQVISFYPLEFVMIVREHDQVKVHFIDPRHHQHQRPILLPDEIHITDVQYRAGMLLVIKQDQIDVINVDTQKKAVFKVDSPYVFEMARFLEGSDVKFVVLCHATNGKKHTQLRIYTVV